MVKLSLMEPGSKQDREKWMKFPSKPKIRVGDEFQAELPSCDPPSEETKQTVDEEAKNQQKYGCGSENDAERWMVPQNKDTVRIGQAYQATIPEMLPQVKKDDIGSDRKREREGQQEEGVDGNREIKRVKTADQ